MAKKINEEIEDIDGYDDDEIILSELDLALEKKKKEIRDIAHSMRKSMGRYEPIVVVKDPSTGVESIKKATELNLNEQRQEFIKCGLDPVYFIETYLTVFDQTQGEGGKIVPFILFPFQRKLVRHYHDKSKRFHVANKYRQAGISTTTCAFIAWYIIFNENRTAVIVANKLGTARDEILSDVVEFIECCPVWMKPKPTKKDTQALKKYDNNSSLGALAAKGGLRGLTPTLLFWDETAWTDHSEKFWTAAQPTLQTGGNAIFVSTPNGYDKVFYKTFDNAKKKINNFNAVELWWFNDPRYNKGLCWYRNKGSENEIKLDDDNFDDEKRIKLMEDGWDAISPWYEAQVRNANYDMKRINQEIKCSFLGSGDNFIAEQYIQRIEEHEVRKPIREEYVDLQMWIWEDPIEGEEYIMVLDISSGFSDDFTSINILKKREVIEEKVVNIKGVLKKVKTTIHKLEQVAEYYGRIEPHTAGKLADIYGKRYNYAYCAIDITGGFGIGTVSTLMELGYENIHYSEVKHKVATEILRVYTQTKTKTLADGSTTEVDLIPGFIIGTNRRDILLEIQRSIHMGDVILRSARLLSEIKTIISLSNGRLADHRRGFHDDSFMGVAIGVYIVNYDMAIFKSDANKVKKIISAFASMNDKNRLAEIAAKRKENEVKKNPYGANAWLMGSFRR